MSSREQIAGGVLGAVSGYFLVPIVLRELSGGISNDERRGLFALFAVSSIGYVVAEYADVDSRLTSVDDLSKSVISWLSEALA